MGRFSVTPEELVGAADTLRSVEADLHRVRSAGNAGGDFGSPELEAALSTLANSIDQVASALDSAVVMAALNTNAAANAYTQTDATQMGADG